MKRPFDVVVSLLLLVLLAPLCAIVAVIIKLTDGGSVLFWQVRVGKGGRQFWCPKFRSMRVGAEHLHDSLLSLNHFSGEITFKMRHDPRMTRIGGVIRKLSIDEVPQLWTVLAGHMSLVGPRPPLPNEVALYTAREYRRLEVTPGLTCFWQVRGRSLLPFSEQLRMDIEYVERRSFWVDLKLLLLTIPAVLSCRGAY